MTPQFLVLLAAALTAWTTTPLCARLAHRRGWVDRPDVRKSHRRPTAYLGGVAIAVALLAGLGVGVLCDASGPTLGMALGDTTLILLAGAGLLFVTGLRDDLIGLAPRHKLAAQTFAALAVCAIGGRIETLQLTEGLTLHFGNWSWLLTVLWIVGVTNAVNLIDGLDGLAAGLGAITCAALGNALCQQAGAPDTGALLMLLCALLGALAGFLPHNFHPARIFMGDAGSLPLGFLLASVAVVAPNKTSAFASVSVPVIALLALGIPILDTLFAMLRRASERRGLMSADRDHIHHLLSRRGLSHRMVVIVLCLETALVAAGAAWLIEHEVRNPWRPLALAGLLGIHLAFFYRAGAIRLREALGAARAAAGRRAKSGSNQRVLDEMQLHYGNTTDLASWWDATTLAAAQLGCQSMTLHGATELDGACWSSSKRAPSLLDHELPAPSPTALAATLAVVPRVTDQVEVVLQVQWECESLEVATRQLSALGRLLDQHGNLGWVQPARMWGVGKDNSDVGLELAGRAHRTGTDVAAPWSPRLAQ